MALAETVTTADGDTHELAGVLPADVRMHDRYQALDHVELRARTDTLTASVGQNRRGHEFHYSSADVAAGSLSNGLRTGTNASEVSASASVPPLTTVTVPKSHVGRCPIPTRQ